MTKKRARKNNVIVVAYSIDGKVIEQAEISYIAFYDGDTTPLIDSDLYRADRRVRRITGEIYDPDGKVQQTFDNIYDGNGRYVRSRIEFDDGTVVED